MDAMKSNATSYGKALSLLLALSKCPNKFHKKMKHNTSGNNN